MEKLLTRDEFKEITNYTDSGLYDAIYKKRLPLEVLKVAGRIRFRRAEVELWIQAGCPKDRDWKYKFNGA